MKLRFLFWILISPLLLSCSTLGGAVLSAAKAYHSGKNQSGYAGVSLLPHMVYLEVQTRNSSALMVLSNVDQSEQGSRHVETWISANKEVLRTQAGFVVGSQGISNLPQSVDLQFSPLGVPQAMVIDSPEFGAYQVQFNLIPQNLTHIPLKDTALLKRAKQVNGLILKAWSGQLHASSSSVQLLDGSLHVVGTHPVTGSLVYGLHCPKNRQCLEYLLRTADQNL